MTPWNAASLTDWARDARARILPAATGAATARVTVAQVRGADVVIGAMVLYVVIVSVLRFAMALVPWAMEGDWKQWIWEYHRYWTPGSFPPGHMITDYQFRVQPPLYYVVMAALSHVMHPGVAARLLSVLAYVFTLVPMYRATTRMSHWVMGLAALVLYAHDFTMFHTTMGGYPRSFGPTLVLLLLDAWIARRHWRCVAFLVAMGALYPSILPPCGLAYGLACAFDFSPLSPGRGRVTGWLVRSVTVVAAGGVAGAFAMMQNALALDWWGPVISLVDADNLAALHEGGRMKWLPLGSYWNHLWGYALQPFNRSGALAFYKLLPWPDEVPMFTGGALLLACVVVIVARRRSALPWQPLLLAASACVAYFAARELAFRMYLPHRVLQHTLPYCTMVAAPVLAFQAWRSLDNGADRGAASSPNLGVGRNLSRALVTLFLPLFLLAGDGMMAPNWGVDDARQPMMKFIREHTPITAQFAGDLDDCDQIPYFTARPVFVNWTMSHPFRLGYWHEIERRLVRMHDAMYADDTASVVSFIEEEKIDYLALEEKNYTQLSERKLFYPIKSFVFAIWNARAPHGFVLANPPPEAVVYRDEQAVIVDTHALLKAWALHPPTPQPVTTPSPIPSLVPDPTRAAPAPVWP